MSPNKLENTPVPNHSEPKLLTSQGEHWQGIFICLSQISKYNSRLLRVLRKSAVGRVTCDELTLWNSLKTCSQDGSVQKKLQGVQFFWASAEVFSTLRNSDSEWKYPGEKKECDSRRLLKMEKQRPYNGHTKGALQFAAFFEAVMSSVTCAHWVGLRSMINGESHDLEWS